MSICFSAFSCCLCFFFFYFLLYSFFFIWYLFYSRIDCYRFVNFQRYEQSELFNFFLSLSFPLFSRFFFFVFVRNVAWFVLFFVARMNCRPHFYFIKNFNKNDYTQIRVASAAEIVYLRMVYTGIGVDIGGAVLRSRPALCSSFVSVLCVYINNLFFSLYFAPIFMSTNEMNSVWFY